MRWYSTKNVKQTVSLEEAVRKGLAPDNGLYMPERLVPFDLSFIKKLKDYTFQEICVKVCAQFFQGEVATKDIEDIISASITFPAPLVSLDEQTHILELFHGPTLAFKDFGARFMAQLLGYFNRNTITETTVLVATSGDTGGAVASGFFNVPGVKVFILYPSGMVSNLQEKQLTSLGGNIQAIEVLGTFDDCQSLVKSAFLDVDLNRQLNLCSANSINIARLIPQTFYYFEGYKRLQQPNEVDFVVPSGNFGNLTAGLFAKRLGLPVNKFIAATNANDVVPAFLASGNYLPKPSVQTISNAMDVGNPSNYERLLDLFGSTWNNWTTELDGYSITEPETIHQIHTAYHTNHYLMDPHTAVGLSAYRKYQALHKSSSTGIILSTAHPAKFKETIEDTLKLEISLPKELAMLDNKQKQAIVLANSIAALKSTLLV